MAGQTLARLIARGDGVAVIKGRLTICPASGQPVPPEWLERHGELLVTEAASMGNVMALRYVDYSTGSYRVNTTRQCRADGVTLQFCDIATGQPYFAIFNATIRRQRTTAHGKAGDLLPKKHFRVKPRSAFLTFWESTGLPFRGLSEFHDYMGHLKQLTYTATVAEGERLSATTLRPLDIHLPGKRPATSRQVPGNIPASLPGKETPQAQQWQGFAGNLTTGSGSYGNTVIRERGNTGSNTPPELQSTDEWLRDYAGG